VSDDTTEENPNADYRSSLTIWGMTMSAQMRGQLGLALYHRDDAPRSTEDGQPYEMPTFDVVLLRDLLNAATDRGDLPRPGTTHRTTTELQPGDYITVGVNLDTARVIGELSTKTDDGSYEEWLTIAVRKDAVFELES